MKIKNLIELVKIEMQISKTTRKLDKLIQKSRQYDEDCKEFRDIFEQAKTAFLKWHALKEKKCNLMKEAH